MFTYSTLNSENKNFDLKSSPNHMLCRFSIDLFALKKCRILHIENLTCNLKDSGINLLLNIALINSILPIILKYEIKKKRWGQ